MINEKTKGAKRSLSVETVLNVVFAIVFVGIACIFGKAFYDMSTATDRVKTETTIGEIVAVKEEHNIILPDNKIILVRIDGEIKDITTPTDEEILMCKKHEGEKVKIKIETQKNKKEILSVVDVGNNIEDDKE